MSGCKGGSHLLSSGKVRLGKTKLSLLCLPQLQGGSRAGCGSREVQGGVAVEQDFRATVGCHVEDTEGSGALGMKVFEKRSE